MQMRFFRSTIIHAGFQCLQLIVADYLPMIPCSSLKLMIEVVGKYGLQPQELNVSLTAIGLLVRIFILVRILHMSPV